MKFKVPKSIKNKKDMHINLKALTFNYDEKLTKMFWGLISLWHTPITPWM